MEVLGGLVLSLVLMVLLAGLGLVTVAGLALMMVLGLLTTWSFRRIFFVSFGLGLLAPLILAGATYSALEDGSLERDLRRDLEGVIDLPDDVAGGWGGNWREKVEQIEKIAGEADRGDITEDQARDQIRDLFKGGGVPLQIEQGDGENGVPLKIEQSEGEDGKVIIKVEAE